MNMNYLLKTAGFALLLGSCTVSADTVDLFTDPAPYLTNFGEGTKVQASVGANIIGGERDIISTTVAATATLTTGVQFNELQIFGGGVGDWTADLQWDGSADGVKSDLDLTGLGGVDFSALDGFLVSILEADAGGSFFVNMWDMTGEQATVGFAFIPVVLGSPENFFIPFGLFDGSVALTPPQEFAVNFGAFGGPNPLFDFSQLGAIQLFVNGKGNLDLRVNSIRAVPAPTSIALMGLALLGVGGLSRRKA